MNYERTGMDNYLHLYSISITTSTFSFQRKLKKIVRKAKWQHNEDLTIVLVRNCQFTVV